MGNYNRGDNFGGRKRFGGDRGSRGGERERPQMHHAVCSDCGRDCEVPFKPSGDKPVFCSECFGGKEEPRGGRREKRRSFERSDRREKKMFSTVCDKCHKDCEVPFKPTGDKPVYCSDCFGSAEKRERTSNSSADSNKKQFDMLNAKLDAIMKVLLPKTVAEEAVDVEKSVEKKVTKKTAEKKVEKRKKSPVKKAVKKKVAPKKEIKKKETVKKVVKKPALKKKAVKKVAVKKKK